MDWSRFTGWTRLSLWPIVAVVLASQMYTLAERSAIWREYSPVIRAPFASVESHAILLGGTLYADLRAVNALLPSDATILLVTQAPEAQRERLIYHRALYHLYPARVVWASPRRSDERPLWWTPTPLNTDALTALAQSQATTAILFYPTDTLTLIPPAGVIASQHGQATLWRLSHSQLPVLQPSMTREVAQERQPLWLAGLRLLLGVVALLAWGYTVTWGVGGRSALAWGLLWPLGGGVASAGLFIALWAGLPLEIAVGVLSVVGLIGATLRWWIDQRGTQGEYDVAPAYQATRPKSRLIGLIAGAALVALSLEVALLALGRPLADWDSWVTWGFKARAIFMDGGLTSGPFDATRLITNIDYPLNLPLTEAWLYAWLGAADDQLVGVVALLWWLSFLAVLYGVLRLRLPPANALAWTALLAATPRLARAATSGYADIPLATLALIVWGGWLVWLDRDQPLKAGAGLRGSIVALGLLGWTKNEGWLLVGLFMLMALWREYKSRKLDALAVGLMLLSIIVLSSPWQVFRGLGDIQSYVFASPTWETLTARLDRLPTLLYLAGRRLLRPEWNFVWPAVVLLALIGWRSNRSVHCLGLPMVYLAACLLAYLLTQFVPYQTHLVNSYDRLALHVFSMVGVWLAWTWSAED